jgi:hypothetical protein
MLDHGALPILVDVTNTAPVPRGVEIIFTSAFGSRSAVITRRLALAAGERGSFELFAPVNSHWSSDYQLELRTGGERERLSGQGASKQPDQGVRNVIVTGGSPPSVGASGYWTNDLSREAAGRWTAPPPTMGRNPHAYRAWMMATPPGTTPAAVVHATFVPFADLPRRSEPWASIDAVVIDPMDGVPGPDQLAAIMAYARTGGVVALFGWSAVRIARSSEDIHAWMEPRFLLRLSVVG